MSGQGPRIGPNMFLPRIHAPTFSKPRAAKSSSIPVVPPSAPKQGPLERARGDCPLVQICTLHAERIVDVLIRTRSVSVKREGKALDSDSCHLQASVWIDAQRAVHPPRAKRAVGYNRELYGGSECERGG